MARVVHEIGLDRLNTIQLGRKMDRLDPRFAGMSGQFALERIVDIVSRFKESDIFLYSGPKRGENVERLEKIRSRYLFRQLVREQSWFALSARQCRKIRYSEMFGGHL